MTSDHIILFTAIPHLIIDNLGFDLFLEIVPQMYGSARACERLNDEADEEISPSSFSVMANNHVLRKKCWVNSVH